MLNLAVLRTTGRGLGWVNHSRANLFKSFKEKKPMRVCPAMSRIAVETASDPDQKKGGFSDPFSFLLAGYAKPAALLLNGSKRRL